MWVSTGIGRPVRNTSHEGIKQQSKSLWVGYSILLFYSMKRQSILRWGSSKVGQSSSDLKEICGGDITFYLYV